MVFTSIFHEGVIEVKDRGERPHGHDADVKTNDGKTQRYQFPTEEEYEEFKKDHEKD